MAGSVKANGPKQNTSLASPQADVQARQPGRRTANWTDELLALQRQAGNQALSQTLTAHLAAGEFIPAGQHPEGLGGLDRLRASFQNGDQAAAAQLVQGGKGPGVALPPSLRAILAGRLNADLARVRIHTDSFAASSAAALQANAFTLGNDIFFASGMYAPYEPAGLARLAHELAHTRQQRFGLPPAQSPGQIGRLESQADAALTGGPSFGAVQSPVGPTILREPTFPRRTTGDAMVREAERILTTTRDRQSTDETVRMWSNVSTNFPPADTAGSIARRVWTYLFLRHFTESPSRPGVESRHPRYFFSHTYGWIDGQHFFGFIDYAENHYNEQSGDRQRAFDAATQQGLNIERDQQRVRDYVILGRPPAQGALRYMQVRPPNTPLFRAPQAAAGTATLAAADLYATLGLSGTQDELYSQLSPTQRSKFFTDSAKSAFTYEDIPSNQLGIRFFYEHGLRINNGPAGGRESAFLAALSTFFRSINVEEDPREVDRLAQEWGLPGQERFEAPKAQESTIRRRNPDLFRLPGSGSP